MNFAILIERFFLRLFADHVDGCFEIQKSKRLMTEIPFVFENGKYEIGKKKDVVLI